MKWLLPAAMLAVAALHLLPVAGALSSGRLTAMYGVSVTAPDLELLLRHRAVLFGIVAAVLTGGAFVASWRLPALAVGLVSMLSFVTLQQLVGEVAPPLRRVVVADVVGSALLVVAAIGTRAAG